MGRSIVLVNVLLVLTLLVFCTGQALAVSFIGAQVSPTEWDYTLTFSPLDNYSIFTPFTTITLTGLYGVFDATGPTFTDFPANGYIDVINLAWTSQVLNGGTEVQWIHAGPGTGNFGEFKHVFGFSVFASNAVNGDVSLVTSGMSRDTTNPLPDGSFGLDISGMVNGPTASVPEPGTLLLLASGLVGLIAGRRMFTRHDR
jgi:hypothetical protein